MASHIMKCRLKPVHPADYDVVFTAEELARLKHIFAKGACDWSKPGVGQKQLKDGWLVFPEPGKAKRIGEDRAGRGLAAI